MTRYYAMLDGEKIIYLGEFETFDDADEKASELDLIVVWIFEQAGLEIMMETAKTALTQ